MNKAKAADEATALEEQAEEYPDECGEILLEAAAAWRRAGQRDRADELLRRLIEDGGEDGCYARVELAESHFDKGDHAEAYAELKRLAHEPALSDGPCQLAAELLAEREDLRGAAEWYDRAVSRLDAETMEALRGPDGWMQIGPATMLQGRHEVRRRLGLPLDVTDELTPRMPSIPTLPGITGTLRRPPTDVDDVRDHLAAGLVPREVRMLVFQRAERAKARERWPEEYGDEADEEYYPAAERRWRELAASGVPAIRVMPATVEGLCEFAERNGLSPNEAQTRADYSGAVPRERTFPWPPPRNAPCWCGSGTKYKKCCGQVR